MKKGIIIAYMFCFSLGGFSQNIQVLKNEKQQIATHAFYPILNNEGTKLLYTGGNYRGLVIKDLESGSEKIISTEDGAGYNAVFDSDNQKVYFRKERKVAGKRLKAIHSYTLASNKTELLINELHQPEEMNRALNKVKCPSSDITVTTEDLYLVVYNGGTRTVLNPLGKVPGYIWASLSPSKDKILFTAPSKGTFIADLSGKIISSLGYLNAPVWYDNNWIIGMDDKDNGNDIISSSIILIREDGANRTILTPDTLKAMYPAVSSYSHKIAYNTSEGEIYIMEIAIK